jgi:hypothetical protein
VFIACTLLTSLAEAQSPCEETFPTRLEAAKTDVKAWLKENDAYQKLLHSPQGKAITFFSEHCRFLSKLEIAIRKLDDPLSFVCDPQAGPKPRALTTHLIAETGGSIGTILRGTDSSNAQCSSEDPIDLSVSSDFDDKENSAKVYLIFCYDDPREGCKKVMEGSREMLRLLAQQKAEGKR